jgi:hypothetical protein
VCVCVLPLHLFCTWLLCLHRYPRCSSHSFACKLACFFFFFLEEVGSGELAAVDRCAKETRGLHGPGNRWPKYNNFSNRKYTHVSHRARVMTHVRVAVN